ncbi:hypothetical protein Mapa_002122 [Marchantia paleacea]|nr:hypothetical protein Mapa_002122 [Marchantia paleacea]
MAGHRRPLFVLFGASMTQFSFELGGWGAALADRYQRKADILLRGFSGWNTRRALEVMHEMFPKDLPIQPSLVVVFFGANDAAVALRSGAGQGVPLQEFKENLKKIASYLKGLSDKTRVILTTAPPIHEEMRDQYCRDGMHLSAGGSKVMFNELCRVIKEADWVPSLHHESMQVDYPGPHRYDYVHPSMDVEVATNK